MYVTYFSTKVFDAGVGGSQAAALRFANQHAGKVVIRTDGQVIRDGGLEIYKVPLRKVELFTDNLEVHWH
jgi:hypothetical protein